MSARVCGSRVEHGITLDVRERRQLLRRLEQLADVRRAICDLAAAAQPHAIDDSPIDERLVRVRIGCRLVVGMAVAELEVQLLDALLVIEQRHQQLAVRFVDRGLARRVAGGKEAAELVGDGLRRAQRIVAERVEVLARAGARREPQLAGGHVRQQALHVVLDDVLRHAAGDFAARGHRLLAVLRRDEELGVAADARSTADTARAGDGVGREARAERVPRDASAAPVVRLPLQQPVALERDHAAVDRLRIASRRSTQ